MRILLLHQYFLDSSEGGGSRFNEMTKLWDEQGVSISVIAGMVNYASGKKPFKYKRKFIVKENQNNIEIFRCHVSECYNKNFIGRFWGYLSFVFSSTIAGIFFAKRKYDIIIATSPPLFIAIPAFIICKLKKTKLVFEVRDLWPESAIDVGVLKNKYLIKFAYILEKFIYSKSDLIITLTPAFKNILIEKKNVPSSKIIVIPNGSDFQLVEKVTLNFNRDDFRKKMNWNDKFVCIYVGAHGVANHLFQLILVAERLKNTNVHIVLIGDGMEKKMLIHEAQKRNLKNIEFIDPQPKYEIFKYIKAADIGISILRKNNTFKTIYSNKTFDYFSCKIPVVMAIDGISRELVETAQSGLFAEPENIDDIVNKILIYFNNPNLVEQHGKNGFLLAMNFFNRTKLSELYLTHLQKLIQ